MYEGKNRADERKKSTKVRITRIKKVNENLTKVIIEPMAIYNNLDEKKKSTKVRIEKKNPICTKVRIGQMKENSP